MSRSFRSFFSAAFLLLALTRDASALEVPKHPDGYVTDRAHLLSAQTLETLETDLKNFESQTSNQIVVTIFPSLEGSSLEDFSIHLAEAWKIGQKGKDNGAILIIFKEDRLVRIEVRHGLEGVLPDAVCKRIIQEKIAPHFRQGDFDRGVLEAVRAMRAATKGEYSAKSSNGNGTNSPFANLLILGLFILLGIYVNNRIRGGTYTIAGRKRKSHDQDDRFYSGGSGGGWSGGGFGGGGFGGGGGGSFGGGGASGGW